MISKECAEAASLLTEWREAKSNSEESNFRNVIKITHAKCKGCPCGCKILEKEKVRGSE